MEGTQPELVLDDVGKELGLVPVLDAVTLSIRPGVTALIGPNGAGKSTLLRICAGLLHPTQGTVTIAGHDMTDQRQRDAALARVGVATEEPAVDDLLTVREQLRFHGTLRRLVDVERRIDDLLTVTGLEPFADRLGSQLSRGNRQKVAIARALLHDPDVLLLDEPTNSLDPVTVDALERLIANLGSRHVVVLATHDLDLALRIADRVVALAAGRVVLDEPVASFGRGAAGRRRFLGSYSATGVGLVAACD